MLEDRKNEIEEVWNNKINKKKKKKRKEQKKETRKKIGERIETSFREQSSS